MREWGCPSKLALLLQTAGRCEACRIGALRCSRYLRQGRGHTRSKCLGTRGRSPQWRPKEIRSNVFHTKVWRHGEYSYPPQCTPTVHRDFAIRTCVLCVDPAVSWFYRRRTFSNYHHTNRSLETVVTWIPSFPESRYVSLFVTLALGLPRCMDQAAFVICRITFGCPGDGCFTMQALGRHGCWPLNFARWSIGLWACAGDGL